MNGNFKKTNRNKPEQYTGTHPEHILEYNERLLRTDKPQNKTSLDITGVQWYPGHMKKTERLISKNLPLVDLVVEICDARIPKSSRNRMLDTILGQKQRILLLNKSDMADYDATRSWLEYYKKLSIPAQAADCKSGKGTGAILPLIKQTLADTKLKFSTENFGGIIRIMAVGVPNSGKSSFINCLAGKKSTKVEDRPGVTRGKQWISVGDNVQLLDMPGILAPKYNDPAAAEKLAFTGAVKDAVVNTELLAMRLLELLYDKYPSSLKNRYKLTVDFAAENEQEPLGYSLLTKIGKNRGMLISKGEVDTERAAIMLLDEFRSGLLGKITLEHPHA
ncbi:MAG: ribosome biogenesis GTPase YlqF [Oscillospiraceae bacterium]|nr:ribosome biogenesis GTPase YlqF [Oscillospiraceae bacterium]